MNETDILKGELEHYRNEKEKIRKIIGQIGGTTSIKHDRRVNIIFLAIVISLFLFDGWEGIGSSFNVYHQ